MASARKPPKSPKPRRTVRGEARRLLSGKGFHRGDGISVPADLHPAGKRKRAGRLSETEEGRLREQLGARSKSEDGHAIHLRVRYVKCGKAACKALHGPYVYEVWRGDDGQRHERYLGKPDLG